ncbi:outer membrane protein assembly factor BamE domain-containing protein [Thiobacillus sedimenti]|uniref:Outer membrane protein assembly factor BamE n=1 Tax=Thiobacillus sedimenti TaxID=3110231 RepID=A0ABZ1CFA3_9PROT|nr:outer membrane protein assembly factor BamE [Thiobacillus sp. SCUT-2]WRS37912.1 outer membrane protein assembly factor BamE [Thiobacillus sp. SCUT-2]
MRRVLSSALLLSLLAGCSSFHVAPHRIDVQQGNALDQENVARLKLGLNRSQVRFLLGTPLVVDPFRTDRWDYVYLFYKAGNLTEQKHITLYFDGDTLARIEGDVPEQVLHSAPPVAPQAAPAAAGAVAEPAVAAATGTPPAEAARPAEPIVQTAPVASAPAPAATALAAQPEPAKAEPVPPAAATSASVEPVTAAPAAQAVPATANEPVKAEPAAAPTAAQTSVVAPLPSPAEAPPYVDPRTPPELSLKPETDVTQLKPDAMPSFPEAQPSAPSAGDPVLNAVNAWADAWRHRDVAAYLAAYDASFVPEGGASRDAWAARKRQALAAAGRIEVKIDAPTVEKGDDGTATVTFRQAYRSARYHDVVRKQLRMVERDGRWLITEEKVLDVPTEGRP